MVTPLQRCSWNRPPTQGSKLQPRRGARTAECPHVSTRSCQACCELGLSASGRGDAAPDVFAQSNDWERVVPPTLKLVPCYADNYKKRMDIPPNFHPHTGIASWNASISSSATISTLEDSPTDYFGLGKLAIAGEERFHSLTDLKWCGFDVLSPRTDIDTRTGSRSSSVGIMSRPSQSRH